MKPTNIHFPKNALNGVKVKIRRIVVRHRSVTLGAFTVMLATAMLLSFLIVDSRLNVTIGSHAADYFTDTVTISAVPGQNDTRILTVSTTITEDVRKDPEDIKNGIKAIFTYDNEEVEGVVSVEMLQTSSPSPSPSPFESEVSSAPVINSDRGVVSGTDVSSGQDVSSGVVSGTDVSSGQDISSGQDVSSGVVSMTDVSSGENVVKAQFKVTATFTFSRAVRSGNYQISYNGESITDTVNWEADPVINKVSVDGAVIENNICYIHTSQKTKKVNLKVNITSPSDFYSLKMKCGQKNTTITLDSLTNEYQFNSITVNNNSKLTLSIIYNDLTISSREITFKLASSTIGLKEIGDVNHKSESIASTFFTNQEYVKFTFNVTNPIPGFKIVADEQSSDPLTASSQDIVFEYKTTSLEENKKKTITFYLTDQDGQYVSSAKANKYISAKAYIYIDKTAPLVSYKGIFSASKQNESYTLGKEISGNWINKRIFAIKFTINDEGAGFVSNFILNNFSLVLANTHEAKYIDNSNGVYRAYFDLSNKDPIDTADLKLTLKSLSDAIGNESDREASTGKGIDVTPPVITEQDITVSKNDGQESSYGPYAINDSITIKIKNTKDISGFSKVLVTIGTNSFTARRNEGDIWSVNNIDISSIRDVSDDGKISVKVKATDNAGNQSEEYSFELTVNNPPVLDNETPVTVYVNDKQVESDTNGAAKINDTIRYVFNVSDLDDDSVSITALKLAILLKGRNDTYTTQKTVTISGKYDADENKNITVEYKIPPKSTEESGTDNTFRNGSFISVASVTMTDNHGNTPTYTKPKCNMVQYLEPFKISDYTVEGISVKVADKAEDKDKFACNNDTLMITATVTPKYSANNQKVKIKPVFVTYSIGGINLDGNKVDATKGYTDMESVNADVTYTLVDDAGNEGYGEPDEDGNVVNTFTCHINSDVIYYAPITKENITISCVSSNENKAYAKPDDTMTVSANPKENQLSNNHKLAIESFTVLKDKTVDVDDNEKKRFKFIGEEDVPDITFNASVTDDAGQTCDVEEQNAGITYYADIRLENGEFRSNGADGKFARRGSNLMFTAQPSHEVSLFDQEVYVYDKNKTNVCYGVLDGNSDKSKALIISFNNIGGFPEGDIFLHLILKDKAGNVYPKQVETMNDYSIEYDSTSPVVSFDRIINGFISKGFTCTASFSDKNLFANGISFGYTIQKTGVTKSAISTENWQEGTTEFRQSLSLSEEGTYRVFASATDRAGNTSDSHGMTVTIDKTSPRITSVKITPDTIPIFKKGFIISKFIKIDEDFINELICKLSDSTGSYEWNIDDPIDKEGKKTISIIVTDMAGNTGSYDFEVYIDATPPVPVVKDTVSGIELTANEENRFHSQLDLSVLIETPQIANMLSDEFTTLKLLSSDGEEIYDFITSDGQKQEYRYTVSDYGKYILLVEAKDHAAGYDGDDGNVYGPVNYYITFTSGSIMDVAEEMPLLFYFLMSLLALALAGGGITLIILAKKRKKKEASEVPSM